MAAEIWVTIGSGNGLLPNGTKPLPEPMLIYHQLRTSDIHLRASSQGIHQPSITEIICNISQGPMSQYTESHIERSTSPAAYINGMVNIWIQHNLLSPGHTELNQVYDRSATSLRLAVSSESCVDTRRRRTNVHPLGCLGLFPNSFKNLRLDPKLPVSPATAYLDVRRRQVGEQPRSGDVHRSGDSPRSRYVIPRSATAYQDQGCFRYFDLER